ncbi:MAG: response regulator [Bdellovibrio sp.]|nr:response regulator [Bdellovibrio sp.]
MRFLLVEDDAALREMIMEALLDFLPDCEIDTADSADEIAPTMMSQALNPKFHYDLIISDVTLQGSMTGFDLWKVTETQFPHTEFLFISGISTLQFLEKTQGSQRLPVYLAKPFLIEELIRIVSELLHLNPSQTDNQEDENP